jgi:hypothetical protein
MAATPTTVVIVAMLCLMPTPTVVLMALLLLAATAAFLVMPVLLAATLTLMMPTLAMSTHWATSFQIWTIPMGADHRPEVHELSCSPPGAWRSMVTPSRNASTTCHHSRNRRRSSR